ncbi:MAG: autotransporter-associated beta strand repeat-containing protein [Opitutae bacterium]|nr:autotransporter-associated beta strand repeat-containing protein [Opitutae bacterium]
MTTLKFFLSTLVAASAMAIVPCVNARADGLSDASGSGTADDPYSSTSEVKNISFSDFSSSDTVYIDGLIGYLEGVNTTYECNINIGPGGFTLSNGFSSVQDGGTGLTAYKFTGTISGSGDWTAGLNEVPFRFTFTGDLSGYSGNLSVTSGTTDRGASYIYFGDGGTAAATTNVSGTGEIASCLDLKYNYSSFTDDEGNAVATTLTVGNTLVRAVNMEFAGDVDYEVSSDLAGYDPSAKTATLTISNEGKTTVSGTIYGFGSITVSSSSTLVLDGAVVLASAISNSGSIVLKKGASEYSTANKTVFDLASIYSSGTTSYTLISGAENSSLVVDENDSWSDLGVTNFAYYGAPERLVNLVIGDTGTISVDSIQKITVTWNGDSGDTWNAKNVNWLSPTYGADCRFLSGDSVIFGATGDSTASASVVNFDSSDYIEVGTMTVAGGSFSLDNSTGATIKGATLTIASGAELRVGTSAEQQMTLSFDEIKLGGTLIYDNEKNEWTSLEFTDAGAHLYIYDLGAGYENSLDGLSIGKTTVSADAKITSYFTDSENYTQLSLGTLSGSGNLTVVGSDETVYGQTLYMQVGAMTDYTGTLSIEKGSSGAVYLTLVGDNAYDNNAATIVVGEGGTLDINGKHETTFGLTLAGGTLTSAGSVGTTVKQLPTITVTADSTVNAGEGVSYGMLASNYGESDIYLGGNTLTKTGAGTFFLVDTSIYNSAEKDATVAAGTIAVSEGTLSLDGVDASAATITVASGATLDISVIDNVSGASKVGSLNSAGTVKIESNCSLAITGDSTISGEFVNSSGNAIAISNGAVVDLTGVTTSQNGGNAGLSVSGEGSTLKIANYAWGSSSNFGSSMYNGLLQISDGGTLEITASQASGGAGDRGFAVTSGTGTYKYSGSGTSYISQASDPRNIHLGDGATLVFDVENAGATLDVAMKIANGMSDSSDVSGTATTSTGALIKAGAGTLEMSGDNLYSGGTTVSAGTLVVKNGNALGSGNVTVASGATMQLDTTLTVSTSASEVSFAAGSTLVLSEELFASATTTYSSDVEQISVAVVTSNNIEFGSTELNTASDSDVTELVNASGVNINSGIYQVTAWTYTDNTLYVSAQLPEPSMFGIVAGLGALALAATRRNRRRHNRKA